VPAEYALPTEIWREVVARRKRYEEVHDKLAKGEIRGINDFITYNLDIRQLAQDVIETSEGPELLRAFYHAIEKVTVLDPTCGSGAFLFAALNILEPLYEACLDLLWRTRPRNTAVRSFNLQNVVSRFCLTRSSRTFPCYLTMWLYFTSVQDNLAGATAVLECSL
jgi:hypothetical protein